MCGGRQELGELELHRDGEMGSSSSLAKAAPWAAAARTPATVTFGYPAVICPTVIPAARQSRITLTGTRVPAIMAWPCITCGSAEIMSGCSLATAQVCSVSSGKRNTLSQLGRGAAGQVRAMLARWAGPVH
jgi:hypothetical protein